MESESGWSLENYVEGWLAIRLTFKFCSFSFHDMKFKKTQRQDLLQHTKWNIYET